MSSVYKINVNPADPEAEKSSLVLQHLTIVKCLRNWQKQKKKTDSVAEKG